MTEPVVPTEGELDALTKGEIAEKYDVPETGTKAEMVAAVLAKFESSASDAGATSAPPADQTPPATGGVVLALVSGHDGDTFIVGDTVIRTEAKGATTVAAADVDTILAAATASGVTVQEVS